MARPTGVAIAAAAIVLVGAFLGFLAMTMLIGSFGLVQHSEGNTGIFGNGLLGGLGLFFGTILLVFAASTTVVGVALWRMRKWARVSAISLLTSCGALFAIALLKSPTPSAFLVGVAFIATAAGMVWYLSQAEVKDAFDNEGRAPLRSPVMAAPRATPRS
jgi:hypothetical protein